MAKKKRKAWKVTLRPAEPPFTKTSTYTATNGETMEQQRELVRIMEVYAETEAGAAEYAREQALAEHQQHGTALYQVSSVEAV
jgi:hypothetical protein